MPNNFRGYFYGKKVWPRLLLGRNKALYLNKKCFCLPLKWEDVSFNEVIQKLESNSTLINNCLPLDNVFLKKEIYLNKIESQTTIFFGHESVTFQRNGSLL